MSNITVTHEQQRVINLIKEKPTAILNAVIDSASNGTYAKDNVVPSYVRTLDGLSAEQIVLAWHGYAKVEPQYVSFDEAMNAHSKGKPVNLKVSRGLNFCFGGERSDDSLFNSMAAHRVTLKHMIEGKWTIEGDNL